MVMLKGFEKEVEVDSRKHKVKVIDGSAKLQKTKSGKILLKISVTAEVDGIRDDYMITFRRKGKTDVGYTYAKADAPGGRETDAERYSILIKALTDKEPKVYRLKDGRIMIVFNELRHFARYRELAKNILMWIIVV